MGDWSFESKKENAAMTGLQVVALLAGAGLGTYLLRYMPLRWYLRLQSAFQRPMLRAALTALGPAAIVALLVVSLNGLIDFSSVEQGRADLLRIVLALGTIWFSHKYSKNTIIATFSGVAMYALLLWVQSP